MTPRKRPAPLRWRALFKTKKHGAYLRTSGSPVVIFGSRNPLDESYIFDPTFIETKAQVRKLRAWLKKAERWLK